MAVYTFQNGQVLTAEQLNDSFNAKADTESPTLTGEVNMYGATEVSVNSATFFIRNNSDITKEARLSTIKIATNTSRVYFLPNADITFAGLENNQTFTGNNTFSGSITMSGSPINGGNRADVASGTTVDLTNTPNYVRITGSNTIGAFTIPNGGQRTVLFQSSLTLTNSSTLILPGGVDITTSSGDVAILQGEGSSQVRVISFQKAENEVIGSSQNTISGTDYNITLLGGINIQSGIKTTATPSGNSGTDSVVFPTAFSAAPNVLVSGFNNTSDYAIFSVTSVTTSGFVYNWVKRDPSGGTITSDMTWIAIGPA